MKKEQKNRSLFAAILKSFVISLNHCTYFHFDPIVVKNL